MSTKATQPDVQVFASTLKSYKELIDADIASYAKTVEKSTLQDYGAYARLATDAYLQILARGGKRIRGALVMTGYYMCGGTDKKMILEAARAIEMMQAYILILDDIQDRSHMRRGGPTAHESLAAYHRSHHLSGDADHFGVALALNGAISAAHSATVTLTELDGVDDARRLEAARVLNQTMLTTAHGQTNDIMYEVSAKVSAEEVERVMEWKTAHYTFLNPLTIGMVLAGAEASVIEAIRDYSIWAGKAFQVGDDVLGVFGSEFESGKSPLDDIREGKRTVLSVYALEHADSADKNFLIQMLGNQDLTQAEFARCKDIMTSTGALEHARTLSRSYAHKAITALDGSPESWDEQGIQFLRGLAEYLLTRES